MRKVGKFDSAVKAIEDFDISDQSKAAALLESAKWLAARVAALETQVPEEGATAPRPGDDGSGFWIRTEHNGRCPVEIRHGCGSRPSGVSIRFNGICVFHFTESGSERVPEAGWLSLVDVYPSNGRIAGLNWVDIHDGNVSRGAPPTKWIDFLRELRDELSTHRPTLDRIANFLESYGDHD